MESGAKIPIKNIYYMLCYAWNILPTRADTVCGQEEFDNIYNLMARMLVLSVKQLLRQGFHREYVMREEPLSAIRGRINIQRTITLQTQIQKKLICQYDELSSDVTFNQIIKATMSVLIRYERLDETLRQELIKLRQSFASISDIYPSRQMFAALRYNRNNQNYKLIIHICRLVFDGLVTNEDGSDIKFFDFIRDGQMAKLYEKFVLNFYALHLPKASFSVQAPKISWDMDEDDDGEIEYLPEMRTDIVLINKITHTQLIIDTKFYAQTLTQSHYSAKQIVHSGNLYQIYTYMGNSSYDGEIMGMLLYPTITKEIDIKYPIKGKPIMVKTLNLAGSWDELEARLLAISAVSGVTS